MTDTPKIEERENGPLMAQNVPVLRGADGAIETKDVMALCRCGASKNKPFCDGSHNAAGFESRGGTPAGRNRLIAYEGEEITVTYNPMVCSHAAECGRLAAHVFNPAMKPWVQPDKGTKAEVESVIKACPSGALSLGALEDDVSHTVADDVEVYVQPHGPYWVKNISAPVPAKAERGSDRKYVLCRCGLSGNKPFCDGSHRDAKWRDDA